MARKQKRVSLGTRVRRLRENMEMSLESMANNTGYSPSYLAQIENDEVIPPVAVLLTLSRALEVDSGELFKDDGGAQVLQRRKDAVRKRTDHYSYQVLTPEAGHKHLKGFMVNLEPASDLDGPGYQHEGEEFHFVLEGEVEVQVGDNINNLQTGDSLHFNSSLVHKLRNTGDQPCTILVVLFTP